MHHDYEINAFGKSKGTREDNIEPCVREAGCEGVDVQNRIQWRVAVNNQMNFYKM